MKEICEIKQAMIDALCTEIAKGIDRIDTTEAGAVADIIKDLSEAEYYCKVVKAMEDSSKPLVPTEYENHSLAGYQAYPRPYVDQEPYVENYLNNHNSNTRMGYTPPPERYGQAYNEYQKARKHYTTTNSPVDKDEMNRHAKEHMSDTLSTIRDIWTGADVDLKKRMKADLQALLGEMAV